MPAQPLHNCWLFTVPYTQNKLLGLELKPISDYITWRITELGYQTFFLYGFVQLKLPQSQSYLSIKIGVPAHFIPSDLNKCYEEFYPLYGGEVYSCGQLSSLLFPYNPDGTTKIPPSRPSPKNYKISRLKHANRRPPPVPYFSRTKADDSKQLKITLDLRSASDSIPFNLPYDN